MDNFTVNSCTKCDKLVECRNQIVQGVGPMDADIVLVGEAPGQNEDENGEPFVGRSGDILNEALEAAGIQREHIRITNCVRCRPPENRDPHVSELENCRPFLAQELAAIEPETVVPLGRIPTREVVHEEFETVTKAAGKKYSTDLCDSDVIVSVHPAATIYNRDLRPTFFETFETVAQLVSTE